MHRHCAFRRIPPATHGRPAYEDLVTGTLSDAHRWEDSIGDDVMPPDILETNVQLLVSRGFDDAAACAAYGLLPRASDA